MSFLEVRIPISPKQDFFNRVRLIANSVRSLGPKYATTKFRVSVGADERPFDLHVALPWSTGLDIEWVWVDRHEFNLWRGTTHAYIATMMDRFMPPFGADTVLMLDADVMAMRPFDELIEFVNAGRGGIGAVMAHVSPFNGLDHQGTWTKLYRDFGLGDPSFAHEHSGWPAMSGARYSPPYFNTGVVCAPATVLTEFHARYVSALQFVRRQLDSYYCEQIAMTLALDKTDRLLPPRPVRYNFPNQVEFDRLYPEELENVTFLHFLRTDVVDRECDFADLAAMTRLAERRDLSGSNEIFRGRVAALLPLMHGPSGLSAHHEEP